MTASEIACSLHDFPQWEAHSAWWKWFRENRPQVVAAVTFMQGTCRTTFAQSFVVSARRGARVTFSTDDLANLIPTWPEDLVGPLPRAWLDLRIALGAFLPARHVDTS